MRWIERLEREKETYTADNEEPNCMHCDNQDYCFRKLSTGEWVEESLCGADYGWRLYKRTELE